MLPRMAQFRLFISAVSSEFERARDQLAASLRAREMDIAVQSDFRQHDDTTLHKLHDYIRDCQAVVCIIGTRSGAMPTPAEAARYAQMLPAGITEASYTQWEFFFARYYRRRRLRFLLTNDKWEADRAAPASDRADLQAAFVRWLEHEQGLDRGEFDTVDRLCHLVLREDWPKARPEPVVHLPRLSLGTGFRGRGEFLRALHAGLQAGRDARVAIASRAVRGMGGVGKTCAAMEYAWQYRHAYRAVLWCSAETPDTLDRDLAALAVPLQLPQAAAPEQAVRRAAVLRWLNGHADWLLILDNVDTPDALHAVQALGIAGGCLLLTGRLARFGRGIEALDLDVLDADTATAMLLQATPGRRALADDAAQAATLAVQELDRLPLALEHAVAFIDYLGCSFADYRARLRETPAALLDRADLELTHYDRSVFRTWHASVAQLAPPARALLERLAFLAPDPVPDALLDVPVPDVAAEDAREALAGLVSYSLARRVAAPAGFAVHRLVQQVTSAALDAAAARTRVGEALRWVDAAFAGDAQDWRTWAALNPLAPHAEAVAQAADGAGIAVPTSRLMKQVGLLFNEKALHARAEPLYRRALAIDEATFGPDHRNVANACAHLAPLLQATNRLGEAEPLMRRALAIDEASLGKDHPDVAIRLNNLAQLLQATNRLGEAEPLMRRALAIDEASLGKDHPNVAIDLNNLALLLQATNRLGEAEPLMRRALAIDEASLGKDHPNVAIDLNNLAMLLQATNRLGEAEPLMRRALAIDEASLGRTIRPSRSDLNNLARLLQDTNRLGEAEPLMRRALAIDEASLGKDHPNVAIRLNNLAQLLQATNRLGEAEPLMRRALAIDRGKPRQGPSECRDRPQQPRPVAASHQSARRGRTADAPRARHRRGMPRQGPSERRERPQQPRPVAASHQPARRGGTADAPARWRSSSRSSATPATPTRTATR